MDVTQLLGFVLGALFALLFLGTVLAAVRGRDPLMRDVALVFSALGVIIALDLLKVVLGTTPVLLGLAGAAWFLAMPIFTLRLVADVRPVPRRLLPLAIGAYLLVIAATVVLAKGLPVLVASGLVLFFGGLEALAAGYLALEARQRRGVSRARLALAALATAALVVTLLVAAGGAVLPAASGATGIAAEIAALIAALAYGAAFLPPPWLWRPWQAMAAAGYTQRLMAAPAAEPVPQTWGRLVIAAHAISGAWSGVIAGSHDGASTLAAATGLDPAAAAMAYPVGALEAVHGAVGAGGGAVPDGPIRADLVARTGARFVSGVVVGPRAVLVVASRYARLFDEDDLALLGGLGAQTAMLVERRGLLAEQEALSTRLTESVTALEAASAAKSDFLASMSHELRTPLNAIIGFSDLMRAEPVADEQVSVPVEWIDHVHRSGQHLLGLINDVLDLAKVEAGRLELVREAVDLAQATSESVAGLRPLADRKGLRLDTHAVSATISVDRGRLRQILYNLLSNAIKYTPEGGTVTVEAAVSGTTARITVADTGIGIAPDDQAHVFEEFRQVGDAAGRGGGTGLGLALTRRLVEAHGGRIDLTSALGQGSRFTVLLPEAVMPRTAALAAGVTASPVAPPAGAGGDVLVIEDDPSAVRLLRRYLETDGYAVRVAPDGEAGLAAARQRAPAAIVLDVLLPGLDGWEVLRQLKATDRLRDVPVIIVTVVDEREVGLALGAVDYLLKPIEREALLAALARYTGGPTTAGRARRVLAVDDEPQALDLVAAALEPAGVGVRRATSGTVALKLAKSEPFDLVICDLVMPGVDGFAVVAGLKADARTKDIPILILTAHSLTATEKRRLNGRIVGIVDKGATGADGLRAWLARAAPRAPAPTPAA